MRLEVVEEVGSTSDALKARVGEPGEVALLARRQTSGRGRSGRSWQTLEGNLFLSVLLRPHTLRWPGHWSLLAAVVVAETVAAVLPQGAAPRLKWPNDVMLGGGKLAGVLAEAGLADPPWLVIGFGVNLAAAPAGLERVTACLAEHGAPPEPVAFARDLLQRLASWRRRYAEHGFVPVASAWRALGPVAGETLTVRGGVSGQFAGLAESGALLLDTEAGRVTLSSGELAA